MPRYDESGQTMSKRGGCISGIVMMVIVAGVALALAFLSGACSVKSQYQQFEDGEVDSRTGYSSDTEVKSYPVTLKIYADSNLQWMKGGSAAAASLGYTGLDKLHEYIVRYQSQENRDQVTIDIEYVDPIELDSKVRGGMSEGDGILALSDTLTAGNEAGSVDGGESEYLVRDMSYNLPERCVIVTAAGSGVELPAAKTINGEDSPDGSINRLQNLAELDGRIAIASPDSTVEGRKANSILAAEGFYSGNDATSGTYADSIASKVDVFSSQDEAMEAVKSGQCAIGFALRSQVGTRYSGVAECYNPSAAGNTLVYSGAALTCSAEPGVTRDFYEFILSCSD